MSKKSLKELAGIDALEKKVELMRSGYAGIDRKGNIVDIRKDESAKPIPENKLMGNPEPKITKEGIHNFIDENYSSMEPKHTTFNSFNYIRMVAEFHKAMGLPILSNPDKFTEDDFRLRINLLQEELDEMEDSWENEDFDQVKIELLDALCDLQYVLSGAILHLGFKDIFDDAFDAVHKSNMSKVFHYKNEEQFDKEVEYLDEKYGRHNYEFVDAGKNKSIIRRLSDGKILKPSGYSPVSLRSFLQVLDNT
jgi:predicted HAD superfamily Cof-like phosphohydrolase